MTSRRNFIKKTGTVGAGSLLLNKIGLAKNIFDMNNQSPIIKKEVLSLPWKTQDPFIFCAYHLDKYPGGNQDLGPKDSLKGRNIGQDFAGKDGWNMYHGSKVPGFPAHPHSGFETVTVVTQGLVDHSDSLGAAGRFGNGDVQWLTSGKGVQHAEMFPLLKEDANPAELFQIWINLPKKSKKVDPHYKMLWAEDIPIITTKDDEGKETILHLVAGTYENKKALSPTPNSWAADANNHVQIWRFKMDANSSFTIPAGDKGLNRTLYFYEGASFEIADTEIEKNQLLELDSSKEAQIKNGAKEGFFFFLQGKPIAEPMVQYGPFVANTNQDLQETIAEYQRTQFGGWPWDANDPVHEKEMGRFSKVIGGEEILK